MVDVASLETRVTELERSEDRRTGMFSGAKLLWGFIGAVPASAVAFFLGESR